MVAPSAPSSPRARPPGERVAESLPCVSAVAGRARRVPRMRRRQIPAVLAYRIRPPKRLVLATPLDHENSASGNLPAFYSLVRGRPKPEGQPTAVTPDAAEKRV